MQQEVIKEIGDHTLTGGDWYLPKDKKVKVNRLIEINGIFVRYTNLELAGLQQGIRTNLADRFSDRCFCPVNRINRCPVSLVLVACDN